MYISNLPVLVKDNVDATVISNSVMDLEMLSSVEVLLRPAYRV